MSDVEAPLEESGEIAEIGSDTIGETEVEAQPEDFAAEPEYDYLDVDDDLAQKYVKIVREGEEVSVPLKEALDGYNSNSVATKRFQEAAQLREQAQDALRLQQALQANPGLTIQVLASQAGVSVEEFLGMTPAQQQAAIDDNDEYADPLERALAEERQARLALEQRIEQREADEALYRAIGGLKQQYGADDDQVRAVVNQAMQMNLGFDSFPMIYQALAYQTQQQAAAQHTAGREAEEARRRQAAAAAQARIGSGGSATGLTQAQEPVRYNSIREAAAAAIDEVEARAAR